MIPIIAQANNSNNPPSSDSKGDNWGSELIQQFSNMGNELLAFIPKLLIALILLLVGYIISHIVAKGARFLLEKFGGLLKENFANNPLLERSGISGIFARANANVPFSIIVSKTLFWILMIMFLSSSAGSLGLPQISEPLNGLVSFLPRVITAIIISVAGFVIGDLVRGFVVNGASRVGLDYAGALANLVYGAAIATALALGLGMRPLAQNIVSGVYARDLYPVGTIIKFKDNDSLSGKVLSVGPVTTQLENDEGDHLNIPNSSLMSGIVESKSKILIEEDETA